MRILIVLTYYRPHISGLTIYAERLATALAARGHQVTVLTSQFDKKLPREEVLDGVRIVRAPVLFRLSKGVIMPTFGWMANKLVAENDVIQLHLPQFDAAGVALRGRLSRKPTVTTFHCDLLMPPGIMSRTANFAVNLMNNLTGRFTHRIVTYTRDYADHSRYLKKFPEKLCIIPPPVVLPTASSGDVANFGRNHNPKDQHPVIGMAARFATEKGVEVLLNAFPRILEVYPNALIQFVGPYQNIIGEEQYFDRLRPAIERHIANGNWQFVGPLDPYAMSTFYPNLDVLVLPSLNSTEAFGLVQIEAMMNGVPCVASSLPGVRQPVLMHHMGQVFPIGDSQSLAEVVIEVIRNHKKYTMISENEFKRYTPSATAEAYEKLFSEIFGELKK